MGHQHGLVMQAIWAVHVKTALSFRPCMYRLLCHLGHAHKDCLIIEALHIYLHHSADLHAGAELGLQSLPKEVLLKILGQAVLPIGQWMTALPPVSNTQGFPEKPLDLETLKQQQLLSSNT